MRQVSTRLATGTRRRHFPVVRLLWLAGLALPAALQAASATLVGWSEQGLHETDGRDVSVYSLLPPYSTIHAQFMANGKLLTSTNGIVVTYAAVADATGSINTTSQGKGNFCEYAPALFGVALPPDQGLAGFSMPGPQNHPQVMAFDAAQNWFTATGIPLTSYDDLGRTNPLPLLRLTARDTAGNELASTEIAVPVTDGMNCRACHASGTQASARPAGGWVWNCDPDKDYKLNILRFHDDLHLGSDVYSNVLQQVGYNAAGLFATVVRDGRPVLCVRCHASNALPGSGAPGMRPLTQLMHTRHAFAADPVTGLPLDSLTNSAACFQCHAGPETLALRGTHHHAVNADGSSAISCQSCHGSMSEVGTTGRQGWVDEPNCESCHTGTATSNNGQLRYVSAYATNGLWRVPVNRTFALTPAATTNAAPYHLAHGHGGLACAACHGSAHAELASAQANDNIQSQQLQAHQGVLADCAACHPTTPAPVNGGPHGLHPVGQTWVNAHAEDGVGRTQCTVCHGADYRGTTLTCMLGSRTLSAHGTKQLWQGFQIGCYNCHAGPSGEGEGGTTPPPAAVVNASTGAVSAVPVSLPLSASDPSGHALTLRIVDQPAHGTASLSNNVATYFPAPGFVGSDQFTFAAWNGYTDSNLGTVSVNTAAGNCVLAVTAAVPTAAYPNHSVPFGAAASLAGCAGTFAYDWDFGDGTPHGTDATVCHLYAVPGDYAWTLTVTADGTQRTASGIVTISATLGPPVPLSITSADYVMTLTWLVDRIPVSLETSYDMTQPYSWQPVLDTPTITGTNATLQVYVLPGPQFFRLRRVP